jgi:hypothetical protein
VVYPLIVEVSIGIDPITVMFKRQYAFYAKDAPAEKKEIFVVVQT